VKPTAPSSCCPGDGSPGEKRKRRGEVVLGIFLASLGQCVGDWTALFVEKKKRGGGRKGQQTGRDSP